MPEKAFEKTQFNNKRMESTVTNPREKAPGGARTGAEPGKARGVEHPIPEDMALYGDTRHALHHMPLPRQEGPHKYGHYDKSTNLAGSDQIRFDEGTEADSL